MIYNWKILYGYQIARDKADAYLTYMWVADDCLNKIVWSIYY